MSGAVQRRRARERVDRSRARLRWCVRVQWIRNRTAFDIGQPSGAWGSKAKTWATTVPVGSAPELNSRDLGAIYTDRAVEYDRLEEFGLEVEGGRIL
jgi:hypothetical protein